MKSSIEYQESFRPLEIKKLALLTVLFFVFASFSGKLFALPQFFQNEVVKSGFDQPISVIFLPDGRALVAQKGGQVFIMDPQQATPTASLYLNITDIDSGGERGLLDIVVDPNFATNSYIYVVYHRASDTKQHISRFSHDAVTNTAINEFDVWSDPDTFIHVFHHGGGLSFGPDGNLYLTIGEQFQAQQAQDLTRARGKIIRVAPDGSIPAGNYCDLNTCNAGELPEIWAYGLRNPYRSRWDIPLSGTIGPRLFIGEVGGNVLESNEDIHIGGAGLNYGWPFCEGFDCVPPGPYDPPFFTHEHNEYPGANPGTAIIGGIVYRGGIFPPLYDGVYFYGDYSQQYIRYITMDSNGDAIGDNIFEDNVAAAGLVVDIKEGPDGALYFVQIASDFNFNPNSGAVKRISYNDGNQAPVITSATADVNLGSAPLTVTFNGTASDNENDPLLYLWLFGDGTQASGANVTHDYSQNGFFQARLQVSEDTPNGKTTTLQPPIIISVGSAPVVTIDGPADGAFFRAGENINFSATASDNGPLTENSYKWTGLLTHNAHTHPEFGPLTGSSGVFTIPSSGHTFNGNTGFQLSVEVTDIDGLTTTETVNIIPDKVDISFGSVPSGISFFLDGIITTMPVVYDTLIDFKHIITAPQTACLNGTDYSFDSWSNGEAGSFAYTVPNQNQTLTATYTAGPSCDPNTANASPVAIADESTVVANGSLVIDVLDNDFDPDGTLNTSSVILVQSPQHGSVSVDTNTGLLTYNHNGSAGATDNFSYEVLDNNGAVSNEATVYLTITSASCGKGLALDGSDDWVNIPDITFTGDFTVEGWVKLAPGIDNLDAMIGQEGAGPDINFYGGLARLYIATSPFDVVVANTAMQPDTWTHVAITRSGSDLALYLNGLPNATGTWSGAFPVQAVGRGNVSASGHLEGELDEVRLWTIARSAAEINTNYNQSVASGSPGLAAYWTFNETGQVVVDESGSGNDGSLGVGAGAGTDDPTRVTSAAPITENCNGGGGSNQLPVAADDSAGPVDPGASVTIDVLANDTDNDGTLVASTVKIVAVPSHGSTSVDLVTGEITYTDDGIATTDDSFTYTVEDNEGAVSNEATVTVSITPANGTCGMGIALDGSDDWVNIPDITFTGDFTIEAWVKLAPGIDNLDAIIGQEGGAGPDINFYGGLARLYIATSPFDVVIANTAMQPDTWTHVAITREGSDLALYLNGSLNATGTWSGALPVQAVGRGNVSASGHLEGELDEVRLWTIARSATEINTNYNQSVASGSPGLAAYWTFNETGQVVVDESGSGNDGSLGIGAGAGNDDPVRVTSAAPITENCNGN